MNTKFLVMVSMLAAVSCASYQKADPINDDVVTDSYSERQEIENQTMNTKSSAIAKSEYSDSSTLPYGSYLEFPENPNVGQCFAKVTVPGKYTYKTEKVMVTPERKVIETIPAQYGVNTKEIVTREASSSLRVIPATYKQVVERVMVSPEKTTLRAIAPTYRTVTEKVMVKPERKVWKVGREWKNGSLATKYGDSGEIRCLVKLPAVYETVTKRVVDQPARTQNVTIPAVYKTITKTVVDQEARTVEQDIPAEVKYVKVREMTEGPKSSERIIPAVYKTKSYKVATQEPYEMWSAILCRTNDNTNKVKELQQKLSSLGYTSVDVDGIIGPSTHRAVKHYQAKRLDKPYYDGRITYDTLKSLDLL